MSKIKCYLFEHFPWLVTLSAGSSHDGMITQQATTVPLLYESAVDLLRTHSDKGALPGNNFSRVYE